MAAKLTDFTTWKAYWQELQTELPEIDAFMCGSVTRFSESMKDSGMEGTSLWVETPDFTFDERGLENYRNEKKFGVAILVPVENGDFEGEEAAIDTIEDIWRKIVARMIVDRRDNKLMRFNFPLQFEYVEPLFVDNMHGYRCMFDIDHELNLFHDSNDWD